MYSDNISTVRHILFYYYYFYITSFLSMFIDGPPLCALLCTNCVCPLSTYVEAKKQKLTYK